MLPTPPFRAKNALTRRDNNSPYGVVLQMLAMGMTLAGQTAFALPATRHLWLAAILQAVIAFMGANTISLRDVVNLVAGLTFFVVGALMRAHSEEKLLRAAFGSGYEAYALRVKRFHSVALVDTLINS